LFSPHCQLLFYLFYFYFEKKMNFWGIPELGYDKSIEVNPEIEIEI
jgi:hypothetical protein